MSTLYLIDDEKDILEILSSIAEDIGLNVLSYSKATYFFEDNPVFEPNSLLVLDLNMPEMDGIEVMRRLSKLPDPPALILASGHDFGVLQSAEKLGKAHNLNIITSFTKPVQLDEFQSILERFILENKQTLKSKHNKVTHDISSSALEDAIRNNEFVLHYQPQIDCKTNKLCGVEALIRWQNPVLGLIYPNHFITLAEEYDLMEALTSWIIQEVFHQERKWTKQG